VFVVDRGHRRIQVFDENGKFLTMWSTGATSFPYDHVITEDQHLWLVDGGNDCVAEYDLDGKLLYEWGSGGGKPGQFKGAHSLTVDQDGNLYVAEVFNGRVQKFVPKKDAEPAKLVGQLVRHPEISPPPPPVAFENEYVRAFKDTALCASGKTPGCGDRIIVAMADLSVTGGGKTRAMHRGDVAVFSRGEAYDAPHGTFFEVMVKPDHPPVQSPKELIPPTGNKVLYDGPSFFIFNERLPVGETRARHSHSQRVVIQLNKTRLRQKADGDSEVVRDIEPNRVSFNPPVIHTAVNVGDQPLLGVVIEFKPERK
jgi:hypothetical protein